jgi:hypothetical protein
MTIPSKRKQFDEAGQFKIGQLVEYHRPDDERIWKEKIRIGNWPYIKGRYLIFRIESCESGVLLWLKSGSEEITAHIGAAHSGGSGGKPVTWSWHITCTFSTLRIITDVARQMEIAAC